MKVVVYSVPVYFLIAFIYKIFAPEYDSGNEISLHWVNFYWLCSSIFYCILFFQISKNQVIKKYGLILKSVSFYWFIMAVFHTVCLFNITLYARFAVSANKLTIGAVTIIIILIFITIKAFKYDKDSERKNN